jgi:hypothetical protein
MNKIYSGLVFILLALFLNSCDDEDDDIRNLLVGDYNGKLTMTMEIDNPLSILTGKDKITQEIYSTDLTASIEFDSNNDLAINFNNNGEKYTIKGTAPEQTNDGLAFNLESKSQMFFIKHLENSLNLEMESDNATEYGGIKYGASYVGSTNTLTLSLKTEIEGAMVAISYVMVKQ